MRAGEPRSRRRPGRLCRCSSARPLVRNADANRQELAEIEAIDNGTPLSIALQAVDGVAETLVYFSGWATEFGASSVNIARTSFVKSSRSMTGLAVIGHLAAGAVPSRFGCDLGFDLRRFFKASGGKGSPSALDLRSAWKDPMPGVSTWCVPERALLGRLFLVP